MICSSFVGGGDIGRSLEARADVLEERELQNGCALRLLVYKRVEHDPGFQKRRYPGTHGINDAYFGIHFGIGG
jgi:hypothetical protein